MALESFYGGKQGVSPVIKAKFKYINTSDPAYIKRLANPTSILSQEEAWILNAYFNSSYKKGDNFTWTAENIIPFTMDECLKRVNYTEVWYGELCIIDTDNKLNPNNGKLFKRTLKQADNRYMGTEDTLYAEYIGQIVGPSGAIPNFDFGSLDAERKKAVGQMSTYATDGFSLEHPADNTYWDYRYPHKDGYITNNTPSDYENIKVLDSGNIAVNNTGSANIQMVPGKKDLTGPNDKDEYFNDKIRYTWCNVRRRLEDKEDDAWIYLGFEIPYAVYNVQWKEEHFSYGKTDEEKAFVDSSPFDKHPFYKEYTFHIPRGTRGIGPEKIFTINPKDEKNLNKLSIGTVIYSIDAIKYNDENDIYSLDTSKVAMIVSEENIQQSYWVGQWRLYNPKTTDWPKYYIYLGSYKDVRDVNLSDKGTLTFTYSDSTQTEFTKKIKWIKSIAIDTNLNSDNYGQIIVNYNNEDPSFTTTLPFLKTINYTDTTGAITYTLSGVDTTQIVNGKVEYIKNWTVDNNGVLTGTSNIQNNATLGPFKTPLYWIKSISYNDSTGKFIFTYDNGNVSGYDNKVITPDNGLSYAKYLRLTTDGYLQYKNNNSTTWNDIVDTNNNKLQLKVIKSLRIDQNNGHMYVTYNTSQQEVDLGLVKGNPTIGVVYTLKQDNNNTPYVDVAAVLNDLNDGVQESANTYIEPTGKIVVSGSDKTGGFVAALVERENQTGLFYYDATGWHFAGFIAGSSSGLRYVTIESGNVLYPSDGAPNPAIILQDNFAETVSESMILPWDSQIS